MSGCLCDCRQAHPDDYDICTGFDGDHVQVRMRVISGVPLGDNTFIVFCQPCAEAAINHLREHPRKGGARHWLKLTHPDVES